MTTKGLRDLPEGTLLFNGRVEGVIKTDCGVKVIEILIPIDSMSNASKDYNERPEQWAISYDDD